MSSFSIIITAGGIGKRMGSALPKQFILVNEKPVLMYTIEQFYKFDPDFQLILTLPEEWTGYWEKLQRDHDFKIPHRVVSGGEERYHSIKNALYYCHGDYVAVHDGVRPLVGYKTLKRCVEKIRTSDAVIPVLPVLESLRQIQGKHTKTVNRAEFLIVQTPQCFKREVLEKAYERPFHKGITDDAGLVEEAGYTIDTVQGNVENIKLTTQADLNYVELFLK